MCRCADIKKADIIFGTPGGIQYFGEREDHCYLGNEVKLYEHHVDALFAMLWHKKADINYYVCTINKIFAKPGQRMVTSKTHSIFHITQHPAFI
uniref:Uncharacterized protein n=1 Tax=Aegilops tauschii subsp. strangulata TaxID=200361 RepID=A0A453P7L1_AEGTS